MKSRSILLTAIILCLLMITCGKDNPSAPDPDPDPKPSDNPDLVSLEIGPDGGEITSKDGKLTLIFPPAALGNTETITIVPLDDENSGNEFDELDEEFGIGNSWELGPGGLEFDKPVTATFTSDQEPVYDADSLAIFAEFLFTSNNGNLESLDSLRVEANLDENTTTVSGQLSHFSPLVSLQENNGVSFRILNVPEMLEVEDLFEANAFIASSQAGSLADLVTLDGPAIYTDRSGAPIEPDFSPLSSEMDRNENNHFEGSFLYGCNATGLGVFGADLGVKVTFDLDSGPVEAESYANFITTIDCVEVMPDTFTLTVDKEGEGNGTIVSDPAGIDCGVDCESDDADFEDGVGAILAATAAEGSVFDGWSGDVPGTCENTTDPCTVIMDQNKSVTANFSLAEETEVAINSFTGKPTGLTSLEYELDIRYTGSITTFEAVVDYGDGTFDQITQFEEDGENEYLAMWEYDYGVAGDYMPAVTIAGQDMSDTESFEIRKTSLSVQIQRENNGNGFVDGVTGIFSPVDIINCEPDCGEDFLYVPPQNDNSGFALPVLLKADPDDGSVFTQWEGNLEGAEDCDPASEDCIALFMDQDRTVTAEFSKDSQGNNRLEPGLGELFSIVLFNPESPFYLGDINNDSSGKNIVASSNTVVQNEVKFGDITGTYPVTIAGAEGYAVIDLLSEEVLLEVSGFEDVGPFFGVVPVSQPEGEGATLIAFGQNGIVLTSHNVVRGFESRILCTEGDDACNATTFDAYPAAGNINSNYIPFVQPDKAVYLLGWDGFMRRYDWIEPSSFFDVFRLSDGIFEGQIVSSYMADNDAESNVLVLTRDVESQLYFVRRDGTTFEDNSIAQALPESIGLDARKLRCADNGSGTGNLVCAVSVFGDDRLAILTWDGETMPSLTDFADVGDGPVGIDLWPLSNGNTAIVSTGFNDHTLTETEVSPKGSVLTNSTRNTLDGCVNPGHAIYIEDPESLKVVGTCYNSDAYFIMESEL